MMNDPTPPPTPPLVKSTDAVKVTLSRALQPAETVCCFYSGSRPLRYAAEEPADDS